MIEAEEHTRPSYGGGPDIGGPQRKTSVGSSVYSSMSELSDVGSVKNTQSGPYMEGNMKLLATIECPVDVMCNRFSADGTLLAVGLIDGSIKITVMTDRGIVKLDNMQTRHPQRILSFHDSPRRILVLKSSMIAFIVVALGTLFYMHQDFGQKNTPRMIHTTALAKQHQSEKTSEQGIAHRLPKCILIGVQKGGTGALTEFLNLHPDIVAYPSEAHFFDMEERFNQSLTYYRSIMPESRPEQIPLETTPAYFHTPTVASRVYEMNSSLRLLLTVRNPVTRIISFYAMDQFRHNRKETLLHAHVFDKYGNVNTDNGAVKVSIYHQHFSRWLKYFPREQIHIIDGEKFTKDPLPELYHIETFLGIRHAISKNQLYFDSKKGYYCMLNEAKNTSQCLPSHKGLKHPFVSEIEMEKLIKFYEPLNQVFFKVAGRSFNWN